MPAGKRKEDRHQLKLNFSPANTSFNLDFGRYKAVELTILTINEYEYYYRVDWLNELDSGESMRMQKVDV